MHSLEHGNDTKLWLMNLWKSCIASYSQEG